jgi:hypothetical protein
MKKPSLKSTLSLVSSPLSSKRDGN